MSDPRTPSPWRRRARRSAVALIGGTTVVVGGFIGYLHTDRGAEWMRGLAEARLNERMAGGGSARLGALRWSLRSGVAARDLVLRDTAGAEVVTLREASVDPALGQLVRGKVGLEQVVVRGVRLHLEQQPDGTTNLARLFPPRPSAPTSGPPKKKADVRLGAVRVEDVEVDVKRLDGSRVTLVSPTLTARADASPSRQDLTAGAKLEGASLGLRWPDGREVAVAGLTTGLEARLVAGAGEVHLGPLSATLGGATADGRRFEPTPIALGGLTVTVARGQLSAALQQLELLALAVGSVEARVGLDGAGPDGTGQGSLGGVRLGRDRFNALAGRPILASDVELTARVDATRDRPGLDLDVKTDGGTLKAHARLDATGSGKPHFTIDVTSEGLAVQRALVLPEGPPVELGPLTLTIDGTALRRDDIAAAVTLDLKRSVLRGVAVEQLHGEGRYEGGTVTFQTLTVDTLGQHLTGRGTYTPATRAMDVRLETRGDLAALGPALAAAGRPPPPAALLRGLSLRDGLAIEARGSLDQGLDVSLPGSRIGLAGGTAQVDGRARLHRSSEGKVVVEEGGGSLQLQGVRLSALQSMLGRPPTLQGRVDGRVSVGSPQAPAATYDLTATIDRGAASVRVHAKGKASREALALDLEAERVGAGEPDRLLTAEVRAPLAFAGRQARLAPDRPLSVRLDVPSRRLDSLRDLLPPPAPGAPPSPLDGPLGRATAAVHLELSGTARAPDARAQVDLSGPLVASLGGTQRARVAVALAPAPNGAARVTTDIQGWLREAGGSEPAPLTAQATAQLARSPLIERPDDASWTLDARLAEQPLAVLAPARPRRGTAGLVVRASGTKADVQARVEAALRGLGPDGTPPIDADATVALTEERATLGVRVRGDGQDLASLSARADVGGINLIPRVRERQALSLDTAFEATLDVPDRALASLGAWVPALREAPGTLGGKVELRGPATRPSLGGKLAVRGLHAADGSETRAELSVQGSPMKLGARLEAVPAAGEGVSLEASVLPLLIVAARKGEAPLPVNVSLTARGAKLDAVLPATRHLGAFTGKLDSDLGARVDLQMGPDGVRPSGLSLQGALALAEGAIKLPGAARVLDRIGLRLTGDGGQLRLESLEAHESDREQPDRSLRATGEATFDGVVLRGAKLDAKTSRWLVFGGSFGPVDAPRGSLDADLSTAVAFTPEGRRVRATVRSLELLAPERFLRSHQPETVSTGDVIEVTSASDVGRLPVASRPAPAPALTPPTTSAAPLASAAPVPALTAPLSPAPPTQPAPSAGASAPPAVAGAPAADPGPAAGRPTEIDIELPPGTHIKQAPLDVMVSGAVKVTLAPGGRQTAGALAVTGGQIYIGGKWQPVDHGELRFDEQSPGGYVDLWFRRPPHVAALRDVTTGNEADVRIHLAGALGKQKPSYEGLGVGSLFDTMALQNAGRTRYLAQPDLPTSEASQLPQYGQLRQMTFMAVNLPHLLFLDRISVWADPYDDRQAYGRLLHHTGESYNASGTARVRTLTRDPRRPGQSEGEVSLDWLWQNTPRTVSGVGLTAGTRGGGGPGLFWEWSSER